MGSFFGPLERNINMKDNFDREVFKEKLNASGDFPMLYMFKFIVPNGRQHEIEEIFPKNNIELKASSGGKYISATIKVMTESAEQVLDFYERASKIEGVIAL
ncbi:DUF493 domain-containing protein [Algoriphagus sediminis]|uniref:DUF493 domain-containing protein n=1 Tax=Algoriphagus sediminis TaxID=3057113 RepID=A0ABT7YCE2_9BACT|nr:DUF493 domain-containing protein [Algoriphagus sediminis]MDN3203849.1 DUF493 domain-containing protein [Algoriphagus sediminis]